MEFIHRRVREELAILSANKDVVKLCQHIADEVGQSKGASFQALIQTQLARQAELNEQLSHVMDQIEKVSQRGIIQQLEKKWSGIEEQLKRCEEKIAELTQEEKLYEP